MVRGGSVLIQMIIVVVMAMPARQINLVVREGAVIQGFTVGTMDSATRVVLKQKGSLLHLQNRANKHKSCQMAKSYSQKS